DCKVSRRRYGMRRAIWITPLCAAIAAAALAQTPATKTPAPAAKQAVATDRTFVTNAAEGGMAEVELGQLATNKATNPDVKQFAQRMVTDHGKANDELKT